MTRALVPFDAARPNTRLAPVLSREERCAFAEAMLADVLGVLDDADGEPTVLSTVPLDDVPAVLANALVGVPVEVDDRPLTEAVNASLAAADPEPASPFAVVMADLALATPAAFRRLFDAADPAGADIVIAPGRGGGTNALVVRHPDFRVDYHGTSYRDHRRAARAVGASIETIDSFRLATDVDEPADLAEVLLHADGAARDWLLDAGFALAVEDGRVRARRE